MSRLLVSLYDTPVLEVEADGDELALAAWRDEALDRWGPASTVLSFSLPLGTPAPDPVVRSFFRNLLPEVRQAAIRDALGLPDATLGTVLAAIGRDCAGAVTVAPAKDAGHDRSPRIQPLDEAELAALVRNLPRRPLGLGGAVRHSLAGAQGKLLLVRTEAGWGLPIDGYPSTHIMKPEPLDRRTGAVPNEVFTTRLAAACGLTPASADNVVVAGLSTFVTSRFDRSVGPGGRVDRVHQEDLCQAFARDPDDKYESADEQLLERFAALLARTARRQDVVSLARQLVFNVIVGNTDAHAKNLGVLHRPDGRIELTPIYDVSDHVLEGGPTEAAMSINGVTDIRAVTRADLVEEMVGWRVRVNRSTAEALVEDMAAAVVAHLPAVEAATWLYDDSIVEHVRTRALTLRS